MTTPNSLPARPSLESLRIYVFSPKAEHIGFAPIAGRVSNCAFGPGRYLYVTNDTQIVRGRIRSDFPGGSPIQY